MGQANYILTRCILIYTHILSSNNLRDSRFPCETTLTIGSMLWYILITSPYTKHCTTRTSAKISRRNLGSVPDRKRPYLKDPEGVM